MTDPANEPPERAFGPDPERLRDQASPTDADVQPPHERAFDHDPDDPRDAPVVLRVYDRPFPAHADRAVLEEEGIGAQVIDVLSSGVGLGGGAAAAMRVDLLVRRRDLDRAARLLEDNRRDSVDIDWNEIDLGEPADRTAARIAGRLGDPDAAEARRMPPLAIVGFVVAVVLVILLVFGVVAVP